MGFPKDLQADFAKVDLPKLSNDLPKWYDSMPASAKEWWEVFMDGIEKSITEDADCPLLKLKSEMQRPAVQINDEQVETVNLQFREKEIAALEEVNVEQFSQQVVMF